MHCGFSALQTFAYPCSLVQAAHCRANPPQLYALTGICQCEHAGVCKTTLNIGYTKYIDLSKMDLTLN